MQMEIRWCGKVNTMKDDLISRAAVKKSLVAEYNRKRTGDGLHLAWIEKAIDDTPPAQQWIPYNERTPEQDGRYLVTCSRIGAYVVDWNIWQNKPKPSWLWEQGVTAWMQMPKPYGEEEQ